MDAGRAMRKEDETMNEGVVVVSKEIGGRTLSLETGRIGRQANASVICRYGDTMVLSAVTTALMIARAPTSSC